MKEVSFKEFEGKRFYYIDFGSEVHGRTSFRLWVSHLLVKKDEESGKEYIEFPIQAKIIETEKGTKILKPSSDTFVFDIFVPCGYRGSSSITPISEVEKVIKYYHYKSPRGNLGISEGMLIQASQKKIRIKWKRSGRLYGSKPTGYKTLYADGRVEDIEIEEIEDLELLREVE